jgi:hypothetical protein
MPLSIRRPIVLLFLVLFLLIASLLAARPLQETKQAEVTPAAAREAIEAGYAVWARARIEYDKEAMESMLAPEFHVILEGREISGEKFVGDVSQKRDDVRLTRFDPEVLTVQKSEKGWTVVITEKLELEVAQPGGESKKVCSFWVTRDGWRRRGGKWLVTYSEAIGYEYWEPGALPPMKDW